VEADDIVMVNGLAVTSITRTLSDLGRFVGADAVEAALNSALRGPDRRKPDVWNEELLGDIKRLCASTTTRRGIARLRLVVGRRGLVRPTGSYPETVLLMASRRSGIELEPQVEVRVVDKSGRVLSDPDGCVADIAKRIRLLESSPNPGSHVTMIDPWTYELRLTD
jgi:hypothetical protein